VGAVPGALPILGGWTAATGSMDPGGWALFGILFFWQLPHFLALAWMYSEDYRRGGLKMLGVSDPAGRQTRHQSVLYALALLPTSLLPVLLGLTGGFYAFAALLLTGAYLASAIRFAARADSPTARGLFRVSLLYLPVLLLFLTHSVSTEEQRNTLLVLMGVLPLIAGVWDAYSHKKAEKELIKPGGENVYPAEVEKVVLMHPAVEKTVVFGIPDPKWKEAIKAVCQLKKGENLESAELIEFVGQRIARFKKPSFVEFTAELPMLKEGTPDRARIKELFGGSQK